MKLNERRRKGGRKEERKGKGEELRCDANEIEGKGTKHTLDLEQREGIKRRQRKVGRGKWK